MIRKTYLLIASILLAAACTNSPAPTKAAAGAIGGAADAPPTRVVTPSPLQGKSGLVPPGDLHGQGGAITPGDAQRRDLKPPPSAGKDELPTPCDLQDESPDAAK